MSREHPVTRRAGSAAALLGAAAGSAEILVGTAPWLGNKNDPTTLGIVTVLLALVIGAASLGWRRATTTPRVLAVATAMLVPALLGLTTAGPAWLPAGAAATLAGIAALGHSGGRRTVRDALSAQWSAVLLGFLALIYLSLGIAARGPAGASAIVGALALAGVLPLRRRSRVLAALTLVAGALPFAILTWWSVVAPITAILALALGLPLVLTTVPNARALDPGASAMGTKTEVPVA